MGSERSTDKNRNQKDFNNDKDEFQPEGGTKNAELAIFTTESLVFGADEDGRDDIASNKEKEEAIMEIRMADVVKDGQKNQAGSSKDGKEDR